MYKLFYVQNSAANSCVQIMCSNKFVGRNIIFKVLQQIFHSCRAWNHAILFHLMLREGASSDTLAGDGTNNLGLFCDVQITIFEWA